jgi:hypothetical protein
MAVLADGCYFPDRAVKKLPEIPTQRALLTWKDGTETLVISSSLDSEAQRLGWLIPLPAVPTEMAKTDPGTLKTLSFCTQPRITHDLRDEVWVLTLIVGWVVFLGLILTFWRKCLIYYLLVTTLLALFICLLPRLAGVNGAAAARRSGVHVEKTAKVGTYDIAVLIAHSAAELNEWLSSNEFSPLPAEAASMTADYIRKGWVFTAIKFTRAESGASTPHPIKLVFPSHDAVYPWKLTTLAGGKPFIELFVVGAQRAETGGLETDFCDQLRLREHRGYYSSEGNGTQEYAAQAAAVRIAHPEVMSLLWEGCVLTKFSGYLDAQRVTDDLHIHWTGFSPYQQHFYTPVGAGYVALMAFVSVLGGICVISLLIFGKRVKEPDGRSFYFLKLVPSAMVAALSVAAITFFVLPKLRTTDVQVISRGRIMGMIFPSTLQKAIRLILDEEPTLKEKNEQMIADAILHRLSDIDVMSTYQLADKAHVLNALQGGNVEIESSPGNFTIEKRDGKITVRVYDGAGYPVTAEY